MSLSNLNSSEVSAILSTFEAPAEKLGNDPSLEQSWAIKAFKHAEVYFSLIQAVDPLNLKLTKIDDEIYTKFRSEFPDLKVNVVNEDEMKSAEGKVHWREFCNQFERRVDDWNMATLLRADCLGDITPENTILVPRIQFLAIEIARNREGLNTPVHLKSSASR